MARLDDLMYSVDVLAMFVCLSVVLADLLDLAACGASGLVEPIAMLL